MRKEAKNKDLKRERVYDSSQDLRVRSSGVLNLGFRISLLVLLSLVLSSCHKTALTTRHLKEGEYLLSKNKVLIEDNKKIDKDEMALYIRQKPNKSILFGSWKLGLQWKNLWWSEKKEKPRPAVVLDTNLVNRSATQLEMYLQNLGYYHARVQRKYKQKYWLRIKRFPYKKKIVEYHVYTGKPYVIDSTSQYILDPPLSYLYNKYKSYSEIKKGEDLKMETLQKERERIAKSFQNSGFFDFTENYVHFDVDTGNGEMLTTVVTKIKQPNNELKRHFRYYIRDVYLRTDYDPYVQNDAELDTVKVSEGIYMVSKGENSFNSGPLVRCLFLKPEDLYVQSKHNRTYKQLVALQMFSLIDMDFVKIVPEDSSEVKRKLDVSIRLSPAKKKSLAAELVATFREGFGVNGQLSFSDKNPFGGSEILDFTIAGGVEDLGEYDGTKIIGANIGPRLSLKFPSFLFLNSYSSKMSKYAFPKSSISAMYNFQRRTNFTRYLSNFYLKYEWNEGKYKKHELNLFDFSFAFITKDSEILDELATLSLAERFRYEDNISLGMKYHFTYSNKTKPGVKHPIYFIGNAHLMGGSALITKALELEKRNSNEAISWFDIRYSNHFKIEADFRYYRHLTQDNVVVFRSFLGSAFVFDEITVVPYEQLYFSGGANSVRGWQQRTLGPGAYFDEDNFFDRLGEVKMEANIEYRFPISGYFKGAAFADVGNVWNVRNIEDPSSFHWYEFYEQFAFSPGLGLRLDFDFFLFRVDAAIPLKRPHLRGFEAFSEWAPNWNFGIGYPF